MISLLWLQHTSLEEKMNIVESSISRTTASQLKNILYILPSIIINNAKKSRNVDVRRSKPKERLINSTNFIPTFFPFFLSLLRSSFHLSTMVDIRRSKANEDLKTRAWEKIFHWILQAIVERERVNISCDEKKKRGKEREAEW